MQKLMKAMHKSEKGFTLVELMVVVVIIGILVAIAIPIFSGIQLNAAQRSHDANLRTIDGAIAMFISEFGVDPASIAMLVDPNLHANIDGAEGFLQSEPTIPARLVGLPVVDGGLGDTGFGAGSNEYDIDADVRAIPLGSWDNAYGN